MRDDKTAKEDRQSILKALGEAATTDKFWGTRLEAVAALNGNQEAKDALIAATKDTKARVRVRAVNSLRATKDPTVAGTYQELLNDQSYAVIHAAATALGETKSATAYDSLMKLINTPSWRDNIRAAGLGGFEALADKRALELGFTYSAAGNTMGVRTAALGLIGAVGKDDPRTFPLLSTALNQGFEWRNFAMVTGAANALVTLGDERALAVFEELRKKAADSPQLVGAISNFETRLRAKLTPAKSKTSG
jgi:HEAT repeat protein